MMPNERYFQQPAQQFTNGGITWAQGEAGAKSFPVAPGNSLAIFDSENDGIFYIKSVDISGMPLPLRTFDYIERVVKEPVKTSEDCKYATKEDLDIFQESVLTKVDDIMKKYLTNKKTYDNKKGDS